MEFAKSRKKSKLHMSSSSMHSSNSHESSSPSASSGDGRTLSMHHPRRSLGGRGREWASESHKLLEAMLELDDSKPFRGPVDPLQYPAYYDVIKQPLDLSQILLNLHRGTYSSLCVFAADMRLMFENYKSFFSDANSEIYAMVHRLSYWFESEVARIGNRRMMKTPHGNLIPGVDDSACSTKRPRPGTLEARIQALQEDNERTLAASPYQKHSLFSTDILMAASNAAKKKSAVPPSTAFPATPSVPPIINTSQASEPLCDPPLPSSSSTPSSQKRPASPSLTPNAHWKKKMSHLSSSSSSQYELTQKINATNFWFGTFRCRPKPPVIFTDHNIMMTLQLEGKTATVTIKAQELVRVCAHFGKGSRHTLFLFVLPSVQKRLLSISSKFSQMIAGQIVMFMSDLALTQISRMLHIFWSMARLSMFGQIFSEIDQQATLNLLANIRPSITQKLPKKYRSSDSGTPAKESGRPLTAVNDRPSGDISELKEILLNLTQTLTQKGVVETPASPSAKSDAPSSAEKIDSVASEQPMDLSSAKPSSSTSLYALPVGDSDDDLEVIIPSDDSDLEPSRPNSPKDGEDLVMMSEVISMKCPITQQTMKHPLRNRHCSHCYDREGVKELIRHRGDKARCPVAGCSNQISLSMGDMHHAFDVWLQIQQSKKDK